MPVRRTLGADRLRPQRLIESVDEYLQTPPIPSRCHPLRCLALLPIQPEPSGRDSPRVHQVRCFWAPARSVHSSLGKVLPLRYDASTKTAVRLAADYTAG